MNKKIVLLCFVLLGLTACRQENIFYSESQSVSSKAWPVDEIIRFEVDIPDTATAYDIYINLRQNTSYEWMNLFLFMRTYYPNHEYSRDTIELFLADESGKWSGKGSSHIKDNSFLFKPGVKFPMPGKYIFDFQHGMRVDDLKNIEDLGLKLVRSERI